MIPASHERKTAKKLGELLIEMGFITPEQLDQALALAKKKSIKVGEAMVELGFLSTDHVYWILGTQLNMSYIEVQPDTVDENLVRQFSLDELRRLQCIPLYETKNEIHFALANPADAAAIENLVRHRPHKLVNINLALPEKIEAALDYFSASSAGRPAAAPEPTPELDESVFSPGGGVFLERDLQQMVDQLTPRETLWIELMGNSWHALVTTGREARPLRSWQRGDSGRIVQWLEAQSPRPLLDEPSRLLATDPGGGGHGAALLWGRLDGLAHQLLWVRRLSVFDREGFLQDEPGAEVLLSSLRAYTDRYPRILLGAPIPSLIKRCWFAAQPDTRIRFFPRPITIEVQIEYLNRDVMQIEQVGPAIRDTLMRLPPALQPPVLLEIDPRLNDRERLELVPILGACSSRLLVLVRAASIEEFDAIWTDLPDALREFEKVFLGPESRQSRETAE